MPRERLQPGETGRISERRSGGMWFASCYVRDHDGQRRRVERSSAKSAEDARRVLQRHLKVRRPPVRGGLVNDTTSLGELFEVWLVTKAAEDGLSPQTVQQYRQVWAKHGASQIGALRIREVGTQTVHDHLQAMGVTVQGKRLRMILLGMFGLAVRFELVAVNPVTGARPAKTKRKQPRAVLADELVAVRAAVRAYADREGSGPKPGRLLPAFVDLLVATGARPNELLATRWWDVELDADPPTLTIAGTLIDHGRIEGKPLHRQEKRKGGAPEHTVLLPAFGVAVLRSLPRCSSRPEDPVFANRDGGWMSLANMRRALRAALPDELAWVTPHSFRRAVATAVRDALGPALAQQQLSHSKLSTTETHYLQRQTHGPDVRGVLDAFANVAGK